MDVLKNIFNLSSNEVFIEYNLQKITHTEILNIVETLSTKLLKFNFKKKSVIGLVCYNRINLILYLFSCIKIGIIPILLSERYKAYEFENIIDISDLKIIITDKVCNEEDDLLIACNNKNVCLLELDIGIINNSILDITKCDILNDDTLFMLITSATGGNPKIVKKLKDALEYQTKHLCLNIKTTDNDIYFSNIPPSHSYGLEFAVLCSFYNKANLYLSDFSFNSEVFEKINLCNVTHIFTVPPFILNLIDYKITYNVNFDSLEMVISGGLPLLPNLAQKFFNTFKFNIASVYGITEVGCVTLLNAKKSLSEKTVTINNDVGKPLLGNEIYLLNDNNEIINEFVDKNIKQEIQGNIDNFKNNLGRVVIKKKVADGGYYGKVDFSKTIGGWKNNLYEFETEDIGYIDTNGSLHLLGRTSSFINVGGTKISAYEIENVIKSFNIFKDVIVFGIKDNFLGEKIVAVCYLDDLSEIDEEKIRNLCIQKLPAIKIPRNFYFINKPFPRTISGKIRFDQLLKMIELS